MLIFIAVALAVAAIFLIQEKIYDRRTFERLDYRASFNTEEAFENEDIYLVEDITNGKVLPVPCVRADTELPDGLKFRIRTRNGSEELRSYTQSVFAMKSNRRIRRRHRIVCTRRGVYDLNGVLLVANDLFGFSSRSKRIEPSRGFRGRVTVLPRPIDIDAYFTSSVKSDGETVKPFSLLCDPLLICGSREYTPLDPFNRINWKSSAVHSKLMVNVDEHTQKIRFNIVLNMQSRSIEHNIRIPGDLGSVELGITVCASVLDRVSAYETPVRIISNAPRDSLGEYDRDDREGSLLISRPLSGRRDMMEALRMLAAIRAEIAVPAAAMFDEIAADPAGFTSGDNIVVISPFIDDRMIVFDSSLRERGVRVLFIITGTGRNTTLIPPEAEVFYRTFGA